MKGFSLIVLVIAPLATSLCRCDSVELGSEKPPMADTTAYSCSGKTHCGQMKTCNEAIYYLKNCPDVEIDGDLDGIPCEEQLCGH